MPQSWRKCEENSGRRLVLRKNRAARRAALAKANLLPAGQFVQRSGEIAPLDKKLFKLPEGREIGPKP